MLLSLKKDRSPMSAVLSSLFSCRCPSVCPIRCTLHPIGSFSLATLRTFYGTCLLYDLCRRTACERIYIKHRSQGRTDGPGISILTGTMASPPCLSILILDPAPLIPPSVPSLFCGTSVPYDKSRFALCYLHLFDLAILYNVNFCLSTPILLFL